jgi:hypothetical protein
MTISEDARWLADLTARLPVDAGELPTVETILDQVRAIVPDTDHASVTVRQGRKGFDTLASTSQLAESLDELQYALNEGPCVEAAIEAEWFRSPDIGHDSRWPAWGPRAAEAGIGSMFSIRLLTGSTVLGALNLYCESKDAFADQEMTDLAIVYATHAAQALASARLVTGMVTAMDSRHTIGLAQGMLMERYGVASDVAFTILQRVSSTENRKLRELAAELVATGRLAGLGDHDHDGEQPA